MRALRFLIFRTIKNRIRILVENPLQFTLTMIFGFIFLGLFVTSIVVPSDAEEIRNVNEVYAVALGLYLSIFVSALLRGVGNGANFFSMADVNFLFSAPLTPKRILSYGLIKQIVAAILFGLLLLFQYFWLKQTYDLDLLTLVYLVCGYFVVMLISQITSMLIYLYASLQAKRKTVLKVIIFVFIFAIIFYLGALVGFLFDRTDILLLLLLREPLYYIPIAGWMMALILGLIQGGFSIVLLSGLIGLWLIVTFLLFFFFKADFYEDVIQTTETTFSAINSRKEGRMDEAIPRNVRVGRIGIKQGSGSHVFYYKHKLETRRSRVFILDISNLILISVTILLALILQEYQILLIFIVSLYISIIISAQNRWLKELTYPFVYMIPERPFVKLMMVFLESIKKTVWMALIIFITIGIRMNLTILELLTAITGYVSFNLLYMSVTVFSERAFGTIRNKSLAMSLYFVLLVLLTIPGVFVGLIIARSIDPLYFAAIVMSVMTVWHCFITAVMIYWSKDILKNAELANK